MNGLVDPVVVYTTILFVPGVLSMAVFSSEKIPMHNWMHGLLNSYTSLKTTYQR